MQIKVSKLERFVGIILIAAILFSVGVNMYIRSYSGEYISDNQNSLPNAEVALILGAAVYQSGALTPVLHDRAVSAVELYKKGKVGKILVSGDNSNISHNEVVPVSKFLINEDVREEDIFLDYAGFDTYDSMYRAREVFEVDSVIIITQYFHLPRSIYIARELGLEANGYTADRRQYLFKNQVREYFANVKAFLNVALNSKPKFLGDIIPISSPEGNVPKPATTTEVRPE